MQLTLSTALWLAAPVAQAACADCNLDATPATITDALAAAIASLPAGPSGAQWCACDVNSDGRVTILDALRIAQFAAGLPITLSCPGSPCQGQTVSSVRVVDQLQTTAQRPRGVNPACTTLNGGPGAAPASGDINDTNPLASNWWSFDYIDFNQGAFDDIVQLTDASGSNLGNPVLLFSAGQDYSTSYTLPGPCNPVDTFRLVLEVQLSSAGGGAALIDAAGPVTPIASESLVTTWVSSDPAAVAVSPSGLLTAVGENSCAYISWTLSSTRSEVVLVPPPFATGRIAACVDSGGVDTATRAAWLPVGDYDAAFPGMPSGPPWSGLGANQGITWIVNTGQYYLGAYQSEIIHDALVVVNDFMVDSQSIGGSSQPRLGLPFAVGGALRPYSATFNDVITSSTLRGIFDCFSQTSTVVASGTTIMRLNIQELQDSAACTIWTSNPCMPYTEYVCPVPPPSGGFFSISGSATLTRP